MSWASDLYQHDLISSSMAHKYHLNYEHCHDDSNSSLSSEFHISMANSYYSYMQRHLKCNVYKREFLIFPPKLSPLPGFLTSVKPTVIPTVVQAKSLQDFLFLSLWRVSSPSSSIFHMVQLSVFTVDAKVQTLKHPHHHKPSWDHGCSILIFVFHSFHPYSLFL